MSQHQVHKQNPFFAPLPPATRKQYGALNYEKAGAVDRFYQFEDALVTGRQHMNQGQVYVRNAKQTGGVLPGDSGLIPTLNMFYGVLRASFRPVGINQGQRYLNQWQETPAYYPGDAPLRLAVRNQNAAPWIRRAMAQAP
jgi:hypothetical protein